MTFLRSYEQFKQSKRVVSINSQSLAHKRFFNKDIKFNFIPEEKIASDRFIKIYIAIHRKFIKKSYNFLSTLQSHFSIIMQATICLAHQPPPTTTFNRRLSQLFQTLQPIINQKNIVLERHNL